MFLGQVPAAGADHDGGQVFGGTEFVVLAFGGGEVDPAFQGVREVQLALDDVVPGRGGGVFHVSEPDLGAGVQRVDGHLLIHRAGDFDAAVFQAGGRGSDAPLGIVADPRGLEEEPRVLALANLGAPVTAGLHQLLKAGRRCLVQPGHESQRIRSQDLALARDRPGGQRDAVDREAVSEAVHFKSLLREASVRRRCAGAWLGPVFGPALLCLLSPFPPQGLVELGRVWEQGPFTQAAAIPDSSAWCAGRQAPQRSAKVIRKRA